MPEALAAAFGMSFNNRGFPNDLAYVEKNIGCCDYPRKRASQDEIWIGIFGNSVSGGLAITEQRSLILTKSLESNPRFKGKSIKILNFAVGGSPPIESLMILSYFLAAGQTIDYVIYIGTIGQVNNIVDRLASREEYTGSTAYDLLANNLDRINSHSPNDLQLLYHQTAEQQAIIDGDTCLTGACYLISRLNSAYHAVWVRRLKRDGPVNAGDLCPVSDPFCSSSHFVRYPPTIPDISTQSDLYKTATEHWQRVVSEMATLSKTFQGRFLYFFLPSPWMRLKDDFIPSDFKENVIGRMNERTESQNTYNKIITRIADFRKAGVNFVDASHLFDNESSDLYKDSDNHLTDEGYYKALEALANHIAVIE